MFPKITALMFSRQNLVHALVKISFARTVALVSLVFSSLHYAYEKICARATLLDKKINFFYVF